MENLRDVRRAWFSAIVVGLTLISNESAAATGFQLPSEEVVELLTTPEPPEVLIHRASASVALLTEEKVLSWKRLSMPRLGLAGFRFEPVSGVSGIDELVKQIEIVRTDRPPDQPPHRWQAPEGLAWSSVQFSPDGRYLSALQVTLDQPAQLVLIDTMNDRLTALPAPVHAAWGNPLQWVDDERMLCRVLRRDRGAVPAPVPGPIALEHEGPPLPTRTYPNRLTDENSVRMFDYYFSSEFAFISVDGTIDYLGVEAGLFGSFKASPDGRYLMLSRLETPYSKLVRASGFSRCVEVWDLENQQRLYRSDTVGSGQEEEGGESTIDPESLVWAPTEPVMAGFIRQRKNEQEETLHEWQVVKAPFSKGSENVDTLATSKHSIKEFGWTSAGTPWFIAGTGKRGEVAIFVIPDGKTKQIWKGLRGSADDAKAIRVNGRQGAVLESEGEIFLTSDGLGGKEPRSSLTAIDLDSGETRSLFRSKRGVYDPVLAVLDDQGEVLLTRQESASLPPTLLRVEKGENAVLYRKPEPYPQLSKLRRERIEYTRKDGMPLSALLYLPEDADEKKPLPTLIWIYPREFQGTALVDLLDVRHFQHHRIKGVSPVAAVLAGYAVIQYPSIPVVHEGEESEDYLPELLASSDALLDYLVENGISDSDRIAVGGHSFGAFSSANLLVHSDRYATAVAMSGAYNRTLTPFGFQHEKRTFWQAREYYADISPFFHADEFDKPILLIHGGADPNPGTPTMQTRRFFHALVGEGVTCRYVELPNEEHNYKGRDTVLHAASELIEWLDTYLK
ncbi:alpha/beta hydrolase family protein [Haloferula chungangensis]|uniref:Alpha/beta hydrolase family protein n=1 Tax=Haloferula chungangensis TaxID=1048331 RepID=A0ABW2LCS6_9BACT